MASKKKPVTVSGKPGQYAIPGIWRAPGGQIATLDRIEKLPPTDKPNQIWRKVG